MKLFAKFNIIIALFSLPLLLSNCTKDLFYIPTSIQEELDKMVDDGFDGSVVYVNQSGTSTLYCAGWHNRENQIPAKPQALFKIASISKLYVAAATSKMVADQFLSLNNTLVELVPDLAEGIEHSNHITLRMLLQHRSGIPDYTYHPDYPWDNPFKELSDTYTLVLDQPADFKPDKKYKYSNTNYLLIGEILDRTLGYSHHQYIKDEMLTPLELSNTYSLLSEVDIDSVMSGYFVGYEHDIKYNDFIQPGGSMVATAEDVGIFLRALIDGTLLNSEEQEIYSSVYKYDHTGDLPGYRSIARYHVDIDAIVIQFVNTSAENFKYWPKFRRGYNRLVRILEKEYFN